MLINRDGINFIIQFEGFRPKMYCDPSKSGNATIGYGHEIDEAHRDIFAITTISKEYALQLLNQDLKLRVDFLNKQCSVYNITFNQNQFNALCSFFYNVKGWLDNKPTMLKAFVDRDIVGIGESILLYDEADHIVLEGLVNRRKAEHDLFFKE